MANVQAAQAYYNQKASFIARGAAEETYDYYSSTLMAAYAVGQPAIVGCHNTHRMSALREIDGFASHDADDLALSFLYRANGWSGVYVPLILARGLTPVDWNGYLKQQLRWARSVVDVKLRLHRLLGKTPSLAERSLGALHVFCYMQNSVTTFAGLLLLAYFLASGDLIRIGAYNTLLKFVVLCAVLQACAFYRQKFYLDSQERGVHWRSAVLRYAKWPVFLWGLWDVIVGRRVPYALTRKVRGQSKSYILVVPHALIILLVGMACAAGLYLGHTVPLLLYMIAGLVVFASLSLILTNQFNFPPPYDKSLRPFDVYSGATTLASRQRFLRR